MKGLIPGYSRELDCAVIHLGSGDLFTVDATLENLPPFPSDSATTTLFTARLVYLLPSAHNLQGRLISPSPPRAYAPPPTVIRNHPVSLGPPFEDRKTSGRRPLGMASSPEAFEVGGLATSSSGSALNQRARGVPDREAFSARSSGSSLDIDGRSSTGRRSPSVLSSVVSGKLNSSRRTSVSGESKKTQSLDWE